MIADSPSILDPQGPAADRIATSWWILFGLAAVVYIAITILVVMGLRGRERKLRANRWILFGGVIGPSLVLTVVGIETVLATRGTFAEQKADADIVVAGHQYWWEVGYPDAGVVTANEVHIPAGEEIGVELRSDDVIHSFWVPELAGKVDMFPDQTTHITLEADKPGTYRGQCAEFCGAQHGRMAFVVVAHEADDYENWLDERRDAPPAPSDERAQRGEEVFESQACAGCHTVDGTSAEGVLGPNLDDVASREELGAGTLANTEENLRRWISDAQEAKPGSRMPPIELTDEELDALVAYLQQLDP